MVLSFACVVELDLLCGYFGFGIRLLLVCARLDFGVGVFDKVLFNGLMLCGGFRVFDFNCVKAW